MGAKTPSGAYLDPLADKVMLASSYIVLLYQRIIPFGWCHRAASGCCHNPGILVSLSRRTPNRSRPSLISKTTTVFQMLTIVYVLWSAGGSASHLLFLHHRPFYRRLGATVHFRRLDGSVPQRNCLTTSTSFATI